MKTNPVMKSVLILLLFIGVALNVNAGDERVFCQYYNDPHLIPFPSSPGGYQGQYICRNNCTEIMLRNDFVEIFVTADPAGDYPIVQVSYVRSDHLNCSRFRSFLVYSGLLPYIIKSRSLCSD